MPRGATADANRYRPDGRARQTRAVTAVTAQAVPGRLAKRAEFLAVRNGQKLRGPLFLLEARQTRGLDHPARLGCTVTKKCGNAVERNRIRRRLKAAMRENGAGDMANGTDYVIVARRAILDARFEDLVNELSRRIRSVKTAGSN